ncbi:hypothetical protein E2C01_079064 [Portunus trituberculatus]|uniref:Uncharacterized protein n=1 Tax=Portunus trituberculatus TaxID=210409 RepID=A0A5B7ISA1_PORTR|nr:hypothetical protein [Portunus trituberculatus]
MSAVFCHSIHKCISFELLVPKAKHRCHAVNDVEPPLCRQTPLFRNRNAIVALYRGVYVPVHKCFSSRVRPHSHDKNAIYMFSSFLHGLVMFSTETMNPHLSLLNFGMIRDP